MEITVIKYLRADDEGEYFYHGDNDVSPYSINSDNVYKDILTEIISPLHMYQIMTNNINVFKMMYEDNIFNNLLKGDYIEISALYIQNIKIIMFLIEKKRKFILTDVIQTLNLDIIKLFITQQNVDKILNKFLKSNFVNCDMVINNGIINNSSIWYKHDDYYTLIYKFGSYQYKYKKYEEDKNYFQNTEIIQIVKYCLDIGADRTLIELEKIHDIYKELVLTY